MRDNKLHTLLSNNITTNNNHKRIKKVNGKYQPNTFELPALVCDENVCLGDIDVSQVTSMYKLFSGSSRTDFSGIESWEVSQVKNMTLMFAGISHFDVDLSAWNVSKQTEMHYAFLGTNIKQPPQWDIEIFAYAEHLFYGLPFYADVIKRVREFLRSATHLSPHTSYQLRAISRYDELYLGSVDISNLTNLDHAFQLSKRTDFSGIESWNTSHITSMEGVFDRAEFFNHDISKWNVSNVRYMEKMFMQAKVFNQDISAWNVSQVIDMYGMFAGAESFNQNISKWDISSVTNMHGMFAGAKAFKQNLAWDMSKVADKEQMFAGSEYITHIEQEFRD